jgi:hypothetical protein
MLEGLNITIVDLLKCCVWFLGGVEIWALSILNIEKNSPSIKRLNVSMVTFCIWPIRG